MADNPPFGTAIIRNNLQVVNTWSASSGVTVLSTPQILTAVAVNNPPFGLPPPPHVAQVAWQPDPAAYQFFGGCAPFMPERLPPSSLAVAVNNPPINAGQDAWPYDNWWIPSDLSPQLSVKLSQGPPPVQAFVPKSNSPNIILGAWATQDSQPSQPSKSIFGVRVDAPSPTVHGYLENFGAWDQPYSLPILAPRSAPASLPITWWVLTTTATTPNWFGSLQEGGAAPSAATTAYGYIQSTTALTTPFWRARQGATAAAPANQALASSWVASTSGPTKGTGATSTTSGDSFITPVAYTGVFASAPWTFSWTFRATVVGSVGQVNMRVWASANVDGTSARELTSGAVSGSIITIATGADNTSLISWSPGQLTLNNEFLFFQSEWQETTLGAANSNARVRVGADSSFVSPPFTPGVAPVAPVLSSTSALDSLLGSWIAPDPQPIVGDLLNPVFLDVPVNNPPFAFQVGARHLAARQWVDADPLPQLTVKLPQGAVAAPGWIPSGTFRQNNLSYSPHIPFDIEWRLLGPAMLAVPVNNPPFGIPSLAQRTILEAWQPPPAQAPVASSLNPAFSAVQVNNPPISSNADNQLTAGGSWLPSDPTPIVARSGPPQQVLAPSIFLPSTQLTIPEIFAAWIPADPSPVVARLLNPVFEAVTVNNPPISGSTTSTPALIDTLVSWIPADPAPQLPIRTVVQGAVIASTFVASTQVTVPELAAAWVAPDLQAPTARALNPVFEAVVVNTPPGRRPDRLASIVATWVQDDPAPVARQFFPQSAPSVFVPSGPAASAEIIASWILQDPQPAARTFVSAFAGRIDNPPFAGAATTTPALLDTLASWAAEPQAFVQPRFVPPISAGGFSRQAAASRLAIWSAWQDVPALPILPRYLPSTVTAVRVDSAPIIGGYLDNLSVVLTAWTPSAYDPWFTVGDTAGIMGQPAPPPPPPLRTFGFIHELGAVLRAGIGQISTS